MKDERKKLFCGRDSLEEDLLQAKYDDGICRI